MRHRFYRTLTKMLAVPCMAAFLSANSYALDDVLDTSSVATNKAASSLLLDVVSAGDRLVAVGVRGHIIYSDNQGVSWTQASVPVAVTLTSVYFPTESDGWAVGHGGIVLHTSDRGQTWTKQFDGNQANQKVIEEAELRITEIKERLNSAPEDEQVDIEYELEDAEFGLEDAIADGDTGPSKPLLDVWFKNNQEGFVVGAYGFFFKTVDGGNSWTNVSSLIENQDRFHLNAISKVTGGSLFIVGEAGNIFRSNDGGNTWDTLDSPYDGSLFGISGTGNVNEVIVFGLRGNLFRSTDLGSNWARIDSENEATLMSAFASKDEVVNVVGNSGIVLVSNNSGESFSALIRENRQALTAVYQLENGNLLLVGEHGVDITAPNGRNL